MRTRTSASRRSFRAVATALVLATAVLLPLTPLAPSAVEASAAVGAPEPTVAAPYLYWSADPAVAGATFTVEYRTRTGVLFPSWSGWTAATVTDCAAASCAAGGDLDPDRGEFQVQHVGQHRIQTDSLSTRYEYRVTPADAPSGYAWVSTAPRTVAADGSNGATYNLGTFALGRNATLACTAGTFYSLRTDGTLLRVTAGSAPDTATIQTVGAFPGPMTQANSLAIGPGGSVAYAVDRSSTSGGGVAAILRYSVAGGWERLPVANGATTVSVVGGAINPLDGSFYVGGYRNTSNVLHVDLYRYNPATNSLAPAGTFNTGVPTTSTTSNNGDIAFDATGTLYVVRSSAADARIFSVPGAAIVAAGSGTVLPFSSLSQGGIGALSGVNGIAFEGDGTLYLADSTRAIRVNPAASSGWAIVMDPVTTRLGSSGDLAGCSTPPTLTVLKNVVGRAAATDQFRLLARSGERLLSSAETTGTAIGTQSASVGPIPVGAGQTYTIAEEMVSGAASLYASSFTCVDERGATITSGAGRLGQVTIPQRAGAGIVCTFANAPLVSSVTIRKVVEDAAGNRQSAAQWTVRTTATAEAGTVTPPAAEQQTSVDGSASWTIRYGSEAARASIAVAEVQRAGHAFVEGSCEVLPASGAPFEVVLRSEAGATLPGVGPGSKVDCTFVNRVLPTTLTLAKSIGYGDASLATQWRLTGTGPQGALPGPAGATGSAAATATITPGVAYALAETGGPATYAQGGPWSCVNQRGTAVAVAQGAVVVSQGDQVTCTVVNATARLTLLKHIDAGHGTVLDAGMFTLTATPASFTGLSPTTVRGNETEVATGASANRFDVRPGHSYTLTERSDYASLGLRLERRTGPDAWTAVTDATIQVPAGEHHVYRFVNAPVPALALPLTGGLGADAYLLGGGGLLLLAIALIAFRSRRSARREPGPHAGRSDSPSSPSRLARIQKGTAAMATISKSPSARIAAGLGAAAIATVTILGGAFPAAAAPNIDTGRQGSIVIHKYEQPATTLPESTGSPLTATDLAGQQAIDGVRFQIRQIGTFDVQDNADWAALPSLRASDIAADADAYSLGQPTELTTATHPTLGKGVAAFTGLPLGAYLVQELGLPTVEGGSANVVIPGAPFIVVVPQAENNAWQYDVHVYPKNAVVGAAKSVAPYAPQGLGSTLTWTISSTAPIASQNTSLTSYAIEDALDSAVDYVEGSAVVTVAGRALTAGTDYRVSAPTGPGGTVSIVFEQPGIAALRANPGAPVVATLDTSVVALTATGQLPNTARVIVNGNGIVTSNEVVEHWGGIELLKTDDTAAATPLQGAVFSIYTVADTAFANPIAINGATTFTSGANGRVEIHGLRTNATGTAQYVVREEEAPSGFVIGQTRSWTIEVPVGTDTAIEQTVVNAQVPAYALPITGGSGQAAFMIGGAGLILGALGFMLLRRRKARAQA